MNLFWLVVCAFFLILESMTTSLTLIWFGVGALITLLLSGIIEHILFQTIIFGLISVSLLVIFTKRFLKEDSSYKSTTNLNSLMDKECVVVEDIKKGVGGVVKLDFETWNAKSVNEREIKAGQTVYVSEIIGVTLIVREEI
ncbi:MAG: NfeD family protein [Peptostreptococcaceae bacterium]